MAKNRSRSLLSRRAAIGQIAAVAALGCSGKAVPEFRMFVYSGNHERAIREVFAPGFEATHGVKVTLFPGWWEGIPKLKSAPRNNPPFDLMITDATQGYPAAKDGLFAPIDFENIPNHKMLAPAALTPWVFKERVGLPYPDSVMTLAYNKELIEKAPEKWSDLLADDLRGRVGMYKSFYMSLYTFAAVLAEQGNHAQSAHELIASDIDEVFRFAKEHREHVKLWWPTSNDMILALHDKSVAAGNMHSPEYLQALREKDALGAVVPEKDRAMVQVFWAIPAGTKHHSLAEQALDHLFSQEVQYGFAKRGMATAHMEAAEQMAAEDSLWKSLYPSEPEGFAKLAYYPYDTYAANWQELSDRWDRTVLIAG